MKKFTIVFAVAMLFSLSSQAQGIPDAEQVLSNETEEQALSLSEKLAAKRKAVFAKMKAKQEELGVSAENSKIFEDLSAKAVVVTKDNNAEQKPTTVIESVDIEKIENAPIPTEITKEENNIEKEITKVEEQATKAEEKLQEIEVQATGAEAKIAENIAGLEAQSAEQKAEVSEIEEQATKAEEKLEEVEVQAANAQADITEKVAEVEAIATEAETATAEKIAEVEAQATEAENEIAEKVADVETQAAEVENEIAEKVTEASKDNQAELDFLNDMISE